MSVDKIMETKKEGRLKRWIWCKRKMGLIHTKSCWWQP